jgi:hypothetical protein
LQRARNSPLVPFGVRRRACFHSARVESRTSAHRRSLLSSWPIAGMPCSSSTGTSCCSRVATSRTRVDEPSSKATMTTVRVFHAATTPGLIGK